jgi:hypothetical protein
VAHHGDKVVRRKVATGPAAEADTVLGDQPTADNDEVLATNSDPAADESGDLSSVLFVISSQELIEDTTVVTCMFSTMLCYKSCSFSCVTDPFGSGSVSGLFFILLQFLTLLHDVQMLCYLTESSTCLSCCYIFSGRICKVF